MALTKFNEIEVSSNKKDDLLCTVPGCKNLWSVNMGKPMCSFHQWNSRTQNSTSKIIDTWYNKDKDEAM